MAKYFNLYFIDIVRVDFHFPMKNLECLIKTDKLFLTNLNYFESWSTIEVHMDHCLFCDGKACKHTCYQLLNNWQHMLALVFDTYMCCSHFGRIQNILHSLCILRLRHMLLQLEIISDFSDLQKWRKKKDSKTTKVLKLWNFFSTIGNISPPPHDWLKKKANPTMATITILINIILEYDYVPILNNFSNLPLPLYIPNQIQW